MLNTSKIYNEDDYLMLSGIQHFYFCQRQWGLIHIEQQWADNRYTAEGQLLHEKADNPYIKEKRPGSIISRAMKVSSSSLGLSGTLDVVEFSKSETGMELKNRSGKWIPTIVEYKRGKPKSDERDEIQLAAEVMCLEETINYSIDISYLYYHSTNQKIAVKIDKQLRNMVIEMSRKMHLQYESRKVPKARYFKNCTQCSLYDICMPRLSKKSRDINNYISDNINSEEYGMV